MFINLKFDFNFFIILCFSVNGEINNELLGINNIF